MLHRIVIQNNAWSGSLNFSTDSKLDRNAGSKTVAPNQTDLIRIIAMSQANEHTELNQAHALFLIT